VCCEIVYVDWLDTVFHRMKIYWQAFVDSVWDEGWRKVAGE